MQGSASLPEPTEAPANEPKASPAPTPAKPARPAKAVTPTPASPKTAKPPAPKPASSAAGTKPGAPPAAQEPAAAAPPPAAKPAAVAPGTVVDVSGLILGRAASLIAQRLLSGEHIVVVNAERSVVTGSRAGVLDHYRAARARGSVRSGPHFPRYADRIFRRTVRGMLPHLKQRGRDALDRLEVYMGVPAEWNGRPTTTLELARARPAVRTPLTLAEISHELGGRT